MVKESKPLHLIDKWSKTDPISASKTLQYGKKCNYESFYSGGLRIAAEAVEREPKSGFTKYTMAMVDWQGQIFVYDHVLVDANNCIIFPIDQETLGEITSS